MCVCIWRVSTWDFTKGTRFGCISAFLPFGLHFPALRCSCRFIPHLLCAADTPKQVQGSSFRARRAGKTEQASHELTQVTAERKKGRSPLRPSSWSIHTPANESKAGMEDEQKARALSSPGLAQKYTPASQSATWTCWETPSHISRSSFQTQRHGGTSGHTGATETWSSSSSARVYLKLWDRTLTARAWNVKKQTDGLVWSVRRLSVSTMCHCWTRGHLTGLRCQQRCPLNWFLRQNASTPWSAHTQRKYL